MLPGTYREDDALGVRLDTLVDARMENEASKSQLRNAYVQFDSVADDREGIWTDDERREVRQMQKTTETLIEQLEENVSDIDDELEAVREELDLEGDE